MSIGIPPVTKGLKCTGCLVGKDYRQISRVKRSKPLEVVFFDIYGPMAIAGLFGDYLYFCVIVDRKTRFTWVYYLEKKEDARQAIIE